VTAGPGAATIVLEAFGVTVAITLDEPRLEPRVRALLPPGWKVGNGAAAQARFRITSDLDVVAEGEGDQPRIAKRLRGTAEGALGALDAAVRNVVGTLAPDRIFVHAGVVVHEDRAIVVPGRSHSGKTTLVSALVTEGAQYCSDEYAVLDAEGLVHPYPRPLSVRGGGGQKDVPVEAFGGVAVTAAFPVGLIVRTQYARGAGWEPLRQSPAQGAMALFANALPARTRPAETLAAIRRAAADATVLAGMRGEAEPTARHLLMSAC